MLSIIFIFFFFHQGKRLPPATTEEDDGEVSDEDEAADIDSEDPEIKAEMDKKKSSKVRIRTRLNLKCEKGSYN